jgi:hypothetical protein
MPYSFDIYMSDHNVILLYIDRQANSRGELS